ncbi:MAG TPA: hypothetical protein GXX14_09615 [Clostridiaceae bacterium]|nr:hypothetical protein [Clostridiaceae bacterium]
MIYKYIALAVLLTIASIYDIRNDTVPNFFIVIGALAGCAMALFSVGINIADALMGWIVAGGVLYFVSIATRGGIGKDDAKLAGCLGIYTGLMDALSILILSSIICGLTGLIILAFHRSEKKRCLPFSPFLLAGTVFTILLNFLV